LRIWLAYDCVVSVFRIQGGETLHGEVVVPGAKNSVLKLMAATLLAPGLSTLTNVPDIEDVTIMSELLRRLGCEVNHSGETISIDVPLRPDHRADYDLVRKMRASICVLGPLIARCGAADVAVPGGDNIGSRGLDMHVEALRKMGVHVNNEHGYLLAECEGLTGAHILLDFPSVGATETILMAAVTARGESVIENAAREPEIVDICEMLVGMGADIAGIGTSTITITGVSGLTPITHRVVSDRIVAGTWAVAVAMTQGELTIHGVPAEHIALPLEKLQATGAQIDSDGQTIHVRMDARPQCVDVVTLPFPGFPTDLQPQFIALNAIGQGAALVTENLFEARFRFVQELARLGADVRTDGHHALIRGKEKLSGAPVEATDIRAGAGLVLAGLVAQGSTTVYGVSHIDRGYAHFVETLQGLGAIILRVDE
jgi:UDP-N-acetylglucosamine 1-carboxyvinyltransferase